MAVFHCRLNCFAIVKFCLVFLRTEYIFYSLNANKLSARAVFVIFKAFLLAVMHKIFLFDLVVIHTEKIVLKASLKITHIVCAFLMKMPDSKK